MKNTNHSLFDKYEMIKDLGTGSSGSVTLVRHISMDQERALKKVPKASAFAESALSEARLLKSLEHPSIPRIFDFEEDDAFYYIVEEYIDDWASKVEIVRAFAFGPADVVVAVPDFWLDVRKVTDLEEIAVAFRRKHRRRLRVATKYMNITRRFFAAKDVSSYRIVESLGATEGAPAAGTADLIVDITTTGETLRENGLRILDDGVILKSTASLVRAITPQRSAVAALAEAELLRRLDRSSG